MKKKGEGIQRFMEKKERVCVLMVNVGENRRKRELSSANLVVGKGEGKGQRGCGTGERDDKKVRSLQLGTRKKI